ncbi:MAG: hypothetical protein A2Y20_09575 [Firmicutes bacterium GWF2_51_9]|nr:MAG: hypothetical protein A2Y20_09575 [Firmicutes bacterium GWF2_51_9]OGS58841.1 MAG: hypothetical protein A2Y19_06310 [Firmicutes bacterium GWE2_51_13]HAM63310.1 hypothetical protein [Erysipelotrichaceae bacterium]
MDTNYYTKIIQTINDSLADGDIERARSLLDEELRMPYIPTAYLGELEGLKREIASRQKEKQRVARIEDPQELLDLLDDENGRFGVVAALSGLNLRENDEVLKKAFATITDRGLLSVLVELCARQQLHAEYTFTYDHKTYTFIPASLEMPEESEGVDACLSMADEWLSNENPSMLKLANEALLRIALMRLPEGVSLDEAEPLTLAVVKKLYGQLASVQEWREFCEKNTIDENRIEEIENEDLI